MGEIVIVWMVTDAISIRFLMSGKFNAMTRLEDLLLIHENQSNFTIKNILQTS